MRALPLVLLTACYLHHEVESDSPPLCEDEPRILPDEPRELWALVTGAASGPEHPAIDSRGRIYFVIDTDPIDTGVIGDTLIAIDPDDGDVAWSWSPGSVLSRQPFATCDGVALFVTSFVDDARVVEWVQLDRRGRETSRVLMPPDTRTDALVLDDDLVVVRSTLRSEELHLSRVARDGTLRWTVERTGFGFGPPVANESLILVGRFLGGEPPRTVLETFSHDGTPRWTFDLDGHIQGPIVPSADSVYLTLARPDGSQTSYALELDGRVRWTLDFERAGNWQAMAAHEGTLILRDWDSIRAVDTLDARELWRLEAHPNIDYAPVFDREGALLLSGGFTRLEPRSGAELWSYSGARRTDMGFAFPTPAVLAGERRIVFGAHNGEVVMIGD